MIRQSRTLRRLCNINIAAAHCRRALRRSQSTTMRKLTYKDEGSWKLLAVAMGLERGEPAAGRHEVDRAAEAAFR
jgi:hypothetical protein